MSKKTNVFQVRENSMIMVKEKLFWEREKKKAY